MGMCFCLHKREEEVPQKKPHEMTKMDEGKKKMPASEMVFHKTDLAIVTAEADDNPIIRDVVPEPKAEEEKQEEEPKSFGVTEFPPENPEEGGIKLRDSLVS